MDSSTGPGTAAGCWDDKVDIGFVMNEWIRYPAKEADLFPRAMSIDRTERYRANYARSQTVLLVLVVVGCQLSDLYFLISSMSL